MSRSMIARYLNPWKHKREEERRRIAMLRSRDGDTCSRCRRPLRFDLTPGHDNGPTVEQVAPGAAEDLANLLLTHRRCHAEGVDHTPEVQERVRRKNEAELFGKERKRA
jgi:uncharacterized ferritin-like protein (DUF455 family)